VISKNLGKNGFRVSSYLPNTTNFKRMHAKLSELCLFKLEVAEPFILEFSNRNAFFMEKTNVYM